MSEEVEISHEQAIKLLLKKFWSIALFIVCLNLTGFPLLFYMLKDFAKSDIDAAKALANQANGVAETAKTNASEATASAKAANEVSRSAKAIANESLTEAKKAREAIGTLPQTVEELKKTANSITAELAKATQGLSDLSSATQKLQAALDDAERKGLATKTDVAKIEKALSDGSLNVVLQSVTVVGRDGNVKIHLSSLEDQGQLLIYGKLGKKAISATVDSTESGSIQLYDKGVKYCGIHMLQNRPALQIYGNEVPRLSLSLGDAGGGLLDIYNRSGKVVFKAQSSESGNGYLTTCDQAGSPVFSTGSFKSGEPFINLAQSGQKLVAFGRDEDGGLLQVFDEKGVSRYSIFLKPDGTPSLKK